MSPKAFRAAVAAAGFAAIVGVAAVPSGVAFAGRAKVTKAATPASTTTTTPASPQAGSCSRYTSTSGNDSNPGTVSAPFRTVQHLVDTLQAGQTGCVYAGTYTETVTFSHGGSSAAPLTLTSYPGQRATVVGRMWLPSGSDYVTVSRLNLDGKNASNLPSPTVNSAYATFVGNDVTDEHTAICFDLGATGWGTATGTLIQYNRIHECGVMPAANHNHGIYVENTVGAKILWNLIYNNADRGVQFYPNAQGTVVQHNVIAYNGEGVLFSGDNGVASNSNDVSSNVIAFSNVRHDVESWYPTGNPTGQANSTHDNCVYAGASPEVDTSGGGFSATNNTIANPVFANAGAGNFTMSSSSPCSAIAGNVQATADSAR